jgi:hypothetical protein
MTFAENRPAASNIINFLMVISMQVKTRSLCGKSLYVMNYSFDSGYGVVCGRMVNNGVEPNSLAASVAALRACLNSITVLSFVIFSGQ